MHPPSRRILLGVGVGLVALKLWLVAAQPVIAIGGAFYDDALFIQLAQSILNGDWLGPYQNVTLMKGPMYPLWIAGHALIGLPLPVGQHLFYLLACLLALRAARPVLANDGIALGLFALLWWNPMSYDLSVLGRVLRQNLYTPTALLTVAAGIALVTRADPPGSVRRAVWGLLAGVGFGTLWMTREESVWIAPTLVLLVAYAAWRSRRSGVERKQLGASLLVGGAATIALISVVCSINARHYGWFGTVELRAPEFAAAYGALQRIEVGPALPFTPVSRAAREQAYAVSPTLARLREKLEGPDAVFWAGVSEPYTGRPRLEREIAGGWFIWFLRDAVTEVYRPASAAEALDVYRRMGLEINQACDEGRLPSGSRSDSLAPRLRPGDVTRFLRVLPDYIDYFVTFRGFSGHPGQSSGTSDLLAPFSALTRWHLSASPEAPEVAPRVLPVDAFRLRLLQRIGKLMRWVGAGVAVAGLVAWVALGLRTLRARELSPAWIIATACLGACAAVVLINALVHALSFPNRSPGALAQAYPLLLLFGGVALAGAFSWSRRPST